MDAVTYPDPRTVDFVNRHFIAVRISTSAAGPLPVQFHVQYTPTVVVVDGDGKEHDRIVGFLPPEQFVPTVALAIGKALFNQGQCDRALGLFDKILLEYPSSQSARPAGDLKSACMSKGASH